MGGAPPPFLGMNRLRGEGGAQIPPPKMKAKGQMTPLASKPMGFPHNLPAGNPYQIISFDMI